MPDHAQLTGPVTAYPATEQYIDSLKKEIRELKQRNTDLEEALSDEKGKGKRALAALANLQHILGPFSRALRAINGEIEVVVPETPDFGFPGATLPVAHGPQDAKYAPWLKKFSGTKVAEVIQALLDHGTLTRSQLRSATESGWSTIDAATGQLKGLGLIRKNGSKYELT